MACHTCDPACANMLNWEGLGHCAPQCSVRNRHRHKKHSGDHTHRQHGEKVSLPWRASMSTFSFRKTSHLTLWLTESQTLVFFSPQNPRWKIPKPTAGNFWSIAANFPCPGGLECLLVMTLQSPAAAVRGRRRWRGNL